MKPASRIRLVPVLIALSASAAAAQPSSPHDPLDEATIRFGPVGLNPSLVLRDVGRDNNVFNDSSNPKSDFTATFSPKLDVFVHPGPMRLTYTTTTDYVYYQTYSSERGTNVGNTLRADFEFGGFKPYVSAGAANTRERLNREIDVRARHRDITYAGGMRVQLFDKLFASAGVRHNTAEYDPDAEFRGQLLETTLNRTEDRIDGGGGVALTPLTSVEVIVARERARFELSPDRDSETWRVTPTVTFSPLAMLNGSAAFGWRRFTAVSPAVPDFSGLVSTVTLGTTIRERNRLETVFSRDLQYSYEAEIPEYIETGLTATWTLQIANPVDLRLNGGRSRLHYRSPALTEGHSDDVAHTYGFSLGWHLARHARAALNGDWRGRASERSVDRTYDNRRIYATVTWGK